MARIQTVPVPLTIILEKLMEVMNWITGTAESSEFLYNKPFFYNSLLTLFDLLDC